MSMVPTPPACRVLASGEPNHSFPLSLAVTDLGFSITDPRTRMLHTFSTDSTEKKEHYIELLGSLMENWHANILEKQRYSSAFYLGV